jgi:hypothetical protein
MKGHSVGEGRAAVGVTGHRRLAGADLGILEARIREALEAAVAANPVDGTKVLPRRLATSLAEGADRLVARVGLELGWELSCPLPFPVADYERDFTDAASLREFRELLARCAAVTVADLPPGSPRVAGYTAAGRAMLADSAVLLAIWDGEPARGEGGTAQIVAEAIAAGRGTIWLGSAAPHAVWVHPPSGATGWHVVPPARLADALPQR